MTDLYYPHVPKDPRANLRYRIAVRKRAAKDPVFRQALMEACRDDVLFWINVFAFGYDPRPLVVDGVRQSPIQPFITRPHQDPIIRTLREKLGFEDIGIKKSRDEGVSWIVVLLALHDWLFFELSAIGLVSKDEDSADNPEDPNSLFWKIDWELTKLPAWMVPPFKRNLNSHTLLNRSNASTITAYAATADVAVGGRKKWFGWDEAARFPRQSAYDAQTGMQQVTRSRLYVSTPKGTEGLFADVMREASSIIKLSLDWRDNPTKNRGLYRMVAGQAVAVDPDNNPLPPNYTEKSSGLWRSLREKGFVLEGKLRSPWYDHECDRTGATPHSIAQELDMDFGGSMFRIFGTDFFARAEEGVRPPFHLLNVEYHPETQEPDFDESETGRMLLWTSLDMAKRPPHHSYVLGCDVSTGLGGSHTSNSVAIAIDTTTMEQVLEYATNTEEPSEFADTCMAIAKWLHGAYVIWECNSGVGGAFTKRLLERHYPNLYYRDPLWRKGKKRRLEAGWWTDDRTKDLMFGALSRAVRNGEVVLHSEMLVKECAQYVRVGEKIVHVLSVSTKDESSRGRAHGDRVIAACLALQAAKDRPNRVPVELQMAQEDPMVRRQREWEQAQRRPDDEWDDRQIGDSQSADPFGMIEGILINLAA